MSKLTNILFDLDGTLTDPKEGITRCIQYTLEQLGYPIPEQSELTKYIGPPLRTSFKELFSSNNKDLIERAMDLYRERFTQTGIFENEIYAGIPDMLDELYSKSFKLFVVTSKPKTYAERIVQHFQIDGWFDGVFGPDLNGNFDSKETLIQFVLQNKGLIPIETSVIGDRKEDILAGKSNGTRTVGVTYGYGSDEELIACYPDHICHSPDEVYTTITSVYC